MLRYIYLLCFIISLEEVFCYKYIDEQPIYRREQSRGIRQARDGIHSGLRKRQDTELDDRSLTQIDVSSFIQAPDELEDFEPVNYDSKMRRKPVTSYKELVSLAPRAPRRPAHRRTFRNDVNNAVTDPTSSYQQQLLISRHLVRNPKKKCAMSKMFPFFSHNKAVAAQKKVKEPNRKSVKKLFHLGACPKKVEQNKDVLAVDKNLDVHQTPKSKQEMTRDEPRIEKRYAELICPKCKKKFLMQKKRRNANGIIQNSRQYFANLNKHTKENVETSTKEYGNGNTKTVFDEDSELRRKKRKIRRYGKVVRKK